MTTGPSASYSNDMAATAFAAFSQQAGGEKALLWARLRLNLLAAAGPQRVLDFGCGTGWLARQAVEEFGATAIAFDPSAAMLAEAEKASVAGMKTANAMKAVRSAGPYDHAFMVFVTPALKNEMELEQAFGDCARVLAKGGTLHVAAADPDHVFGQHAFYECRRPRGRLKPGIAYETDILGARRKVLLTVTDHYWPADLITGAAQGAKLALKSDTSLCDGSQPKTAIFAYRIWEFVKR